VAPVPRTVLLLHSSAGLYGADVQLLAIVRGLDPQRWRAVCVLPERGALAPLLEQAGAEVVVHPLAVLRRSLATAAGAVRMRRATAADQRVLGALARDRGVAVVHDNTSVILGGAGVARGAGAAHMVHVREIWTGGGRGERALWPLMRRRLLRADAVVGISQAVCDQFPPDAAVLLRDGLPRAPEPVDRDRARSELGLPAGRFVVAVVGRVHPWKGQDVLARALAEPAMAQIGAVGVVAGDAIPGGDADERLDALAADLGVQDRLVRLGFRDDVDTVLGAADAVAVPSTRPEPLGLVALEAGAAGLPVVASADGGVAEVVRDGVSGLLVAPGDPAALAAALARLAGDPEEAARLGREGARIVATEHAPARVTDALQELYEKLAESPVRT